MTFIPNQFYVPVLTAEREREERRLSLARAARLARQSCDASMSLVARILRAAGRRQPVAC